MYDELVKRLRASVDGRYEKCDGCPYEEDYPCCVDCLDKMHKQAADAIEKLNKPRWIPVTERLPDDLTRVIVFCEDGVSFGLCEHLIADDEEVVEWHDFLHYPITPTHWMPLPERPKEE